MLQTYRNRMAMMAATEKYLLQNKPVWAANTPFAKNVERLSATMVAANKAAEGQTELSTGVTKDKYALEAKALDAVMFVARSAKSYALDMEDNELRAAVNFARTSLDRLNQGEQVSRMRNIVAKATAVGSALSDYGVDAAKLQAATDAIDRYEAVQPDTRNVIAARSVETESLDGIMQQSRGILERLDSLVHIFDEQNPNFSSGYKAARVVVDAGKRHDKPV